MEHRRASYPQVTTNLNLNNPNIYGWVQSEYQAPPITNSSSSPLGSGRVDLALEDRYTTTYGYHLDATYGGDDLSVKVGGAYDDVRRSILASAAGQVWQNAVCGDGPSINIPGQNYLGCYGMNTSNPAAALAGIVPPVTVPTYPGYGTGYTAGQTGTLTWNGSLVPELMVPQMLQPGPRGWVTGNKSAFYAMTDYAFFRNYAKSAFKTSSSTAARNMHTPSRRLRSETTMPANLKRRTGVITRRSTASSTSPATS